MIAGIVLIIVGLLFLGINFGYINPEVWPSLWRFWPTIFILFGVVMLARRFMPKKISIALIVAILALVTVGAVVIAGGVESRKTDAADNTNTIKIDEPLSADTKKLDIDVKLGAQELEIDSLSSGLVSGNINTVNGNAKYNLTYSGDNADLKIYQQWSPRNWFRRGGNNKSQSQFDITNQLPVNIMLSMGASKIDADFSKILVNRLTLKTGAINGKVKIGDRQSNVNVDVNTGASDITIYIPVSSGLQVTNNSGITKIKYDKIEMSGAGGDKSASSGFEAKDKKVYVNIKAGASSVTFVGY